MKESLKLMMSRTLLAALALASSPFALAQSAPAMPPLAAPAALPPGSTRVLLRAEAELDVDNDEAHLGFYAQEQSADRAAAANVVNARMKDAIARIKQLDPTAKIQSGGYSTQPIYNTTPAGSTERQKVVAWQVRQDLSVTTQKLDGVEKMVGQIQSIKPAIVNVGSIYYGVSRNLQRSTESKLFDMAFDDLKARIGNVARVMGRNQADFNVDEVNLSGEEGAPRVRSYEMRAAAAPMAKSADVAEPGFEPGTTRQTLSFTARASIRPKGTPAPTPRQ
ncbi:hypothetical protein BH10PSE17_BH10PSE17_06700 [soil metagenome]